MDRRKNALASQSELEEGRCSADGRDCRAGVMRNLLTPVLCGMITVAGAAEKAVVATNLTEFEKQVQPFLAAHCVKCHGTKRQKADFFLHDMDGAVTGGKDIMRWEKILEMLSLRDMPPDDEEQPRKLAGYRKRLGEYVAPVPSAKPVDSRGVLEGSGEARLDGPVEDALDRVHRLAESERVRQSFGRHAFRYWMGRNEIFDDSPTLMAADAAYRKGGGSFQELLGALLTSDSFLYRR